MTALYILAFSLGFAAHAGIRGMMKTIQLRHIRKNEAEEQRIQDEVTRRFNEWADHNVPLGQRVPVGPSRPSGPAGW